jgi:four helix bundle protein
LKLYETSKFKGPDKVICITVLKYLNGIPNHGPYYSISNQLSRASMSVGANYRAASRAKSTADFINKLKIVEEECDESMYFMEILQELLPEDKKQLDVLHKEANELLSIIVASIKNCTKEQFINVKNNLRKFVIPQSRLPRHSYFVTRK